MSDPAAGGPLRWHYGPTPADPNPGSMWCYDCGSEVFFIEDSAICTGCKRTDEPDDASETASARQLADIALGYAAKLAEQGIELPEGMPPDSILFGELPPPRTAERPEWPAA